MVVTSGMPQAEEITCGTYLSCDPLKNIVLYVADDVTPVAFEKLECVRKNREPATGIELNAINARENAKKEARNKRYMENNNYGIF